MQTMTQATLDLLKSRSMIGTNKPGHRVTIGGGAPSFDNLIAVIQGFGAIAKNISNWCETTDGRYMCCWFDSTTKALQTGYSGDLDFLTTNYAMESVTATADIIMEDVRANQTALLRLNNGKVLLFASYSTQILTWVKCYISNTGNGGDWVLHGTVLPETVLGDYGGNANIMSCPLQLPNGRIIAPFTTEGIWMQGLGTPGSYIYTSDDGGETWTKRWSYIHPYALAIHQPCVLPTGDIFINLTLNSGQSYVYQSSDGVTWTSMVDVRTGLGGRGGDLQGISFYYDADTDAVYGLVLSTVTSRGIYRLQAPTAAKFIDPLQWEFIASIPLNATTGGYSSAARIAKVGGYLAFSSHEWVVGVPPGTKDLPCKSIAISRTKGAASGLTITADNKGGQYSPDGATDWNQVLWPNAEIIVEQGYGTNLVQTYKGSLDSVEMTTFPQEIRLSARDAMKKALDQTVTGSTGNHVLIYTNSTVESIFISLCNFAGIAYGTVEETGLTIARKEFSWESFADAMQWLAELVGFEVVADEQGLLHFRRDWYPDDGTSVYTFTEGIDIISLGYTIDDRDLYNQVVCHGRDADGNVIELVTNVPGADYWRLPANKIMKIDASDANTIDKLNVIAARAIYLMMSRFRVCNFKAIGVPHLQVGDLITVIESSSTISEVYRVTDLSTNMDNNGYTMDITCHWYSHG